MIRRILIAGAACTAIVTTAAAESAESLIDRARSLAAEGKQVEATKALEGALLALSHIMPLTVREAVLVEDVTAFGSYSTRPSNVFRPKDEVKLYVEPMGFTYVQEGGRYRVDLAGEFAIKLASGETILSREELPAFNFDSARPNREFYLHISYSFEGLRPGDYTIVTQLRDRPSGKQTSFETPIRVVAGGDAATSEVGSPRGQPSEGTATLR